MGTDEFIKVGKKAVLEMALKSFDPTDNVKITEDDVYFVTCTYILGNIKGMFSTSIKDSKYYEVTYNAATKEMYVDQYVKINQNIITF